jgi:hypothetical protein
METVGTIQFSDVQVHAGALALLDSGELDCDDDLSERILTPGGTRSPSADPGRWQRFVSRLRGYERGRVLATEVPVWLAIAELTPPAGGRATLNSQSSSKVEAKSSLTVFGSGFGNTVSAGLDQIVEVAAVGGPLQVAAEVLLNVCEYTRCGGGPTLVRVDVVEMKPVTRVGDVARRASVPSPPPAGVEILDRVELSSASGSGAYTWRRRSAEQSTWTTAVGASVPGIGLDIKLEVAVARAQQFETAFELPFGSDYLVYHEPTAPRLAPLCCRVER